MNESIKTADLQYSVSAVLLWPAPGIGLMTLEPAAQLMQILARGRMHAEFKKLIKFVGFVEHRI